jgi:hypothetical protein
MPQNFKQKVIRKLEDYIEQLKENNESIHEDNEEELTNKTIVSLKNKRIIIAHSHEAKARRIIYQHIRQLKQEEFQDVMQQLRTMMN